MNTKSLLWIIIAISTIFSASAAKKQVFNLSDNSEASANSPKLTVFVSDDPNGKAIIACPGGGYEFLATDHEGMNFADWYNAMGITYAVLEYRLPHGDKTIPLNDAMKAMRFMRNHSAEWNISKIGIMGSSAGGHLASTLATHYTDAQTRPDFQILFYPVISMDPAITHHGSSDNLLGKKPSSADVKLFSNELQVTKDTPPAFIMHCADDDIVAVENSVRYYLSLVKSGVPVAAHFYTYGRHGWGFGDNCKFKRQWSGELEKWLRDIIK